MLLKSDFCMEGKARGKMTAQVTMEQWIAISSVIESIRVLGMLVYALQLRIICPFKATILGGRPKHVFGGGHVRPI